MSAGLESAVVQVPREKLESLEKDHDFLAQIREASEEVRRAERDYQYAKNEALERKKEYDRRVADLNNLIEDGPPKPDPQGKLPFAMDAEDDDEVAEVEDSDDDEELPEPPKSKPKQANEKIPPDIAKLDLTEEKKRVLTEAGARTTADLIEIGNRNNRKFPRGFSDLKGFGPKVIAQLAAQLPTTAPESSNGNGPPGRKAKIRVLGFTAGDKRNIEAGDEYDVVVQDDGTAVLTFPGEESFEFQSYEYEEIA